MLDPNIAIEFNNVGKQYRLGLVGTGSLQHDINRWWQTTILGKEDPYLKIGEVNDRTKKAESDYVWALKDISFKVEQGDVVGIIGKNGAGKSTLLKLLSHITAPSTGSIQYRGRIASLLEVGTGFHPEMTARENIYMNGSIMGMTRKEITSKLDEIIDFAGIEKYIDTPVKRFSSGMTVRLGFAVAAFLEPEILVVDEVLAVGDAEFQKKAIGKMKDVSSSGGRTVLFVSHNMSAVKMLCSNGVVLKNGMVDFIGTAEDAVNHYLETSIDVISKKVVLTESHREDNHQFLRNVEFITAEFCNEEPAAMAMDEALQMCVHFKKNDKNTEKFQLNIIISNSADLRVAFYVTDMISIPKEKDDFDVEISIPNHSLPKGRYKVRMEAGIQDASKGVIGYDHVHDVLAFEILYRHKKNQDEFLFWQPSWGLRLHEDGQIQTRLL